MIKTKESRFLCFFSKAATEKEKFKREKPKRKAASRKFRVRQHDERKLITIGNPRDKPNIKIKTSRSCLEQRRRAVCTFAGDGEHLKTVEKESTPTK